MHIYLSNLNLSYSSTDKFMSRSITFKIPTPKTSLEWMEMVVDFLEIGSIKKW